jgi:hypothetical protein
LVSRLGAKTTYEQIEAAMKCGKCGAKTVKAERMKEPDSRLIWNKREGA